LFVASFRRYGEGLPRSGDRGVEARFPFQHPDDQHIITLLFTFRDFPIALHLPYPASLPDAASRISYPASAIQDSSPRQLNIILSFARLLISLMQKFLVIQTAFLGDAILATGILEKLHTCFPDAEIDYLVRKGNEALFANHPYLHELLVWNKQEGKLKNLFRMLSVIRKRKYDKVINVQRFAATGMLTAFSGAKEKIGFDKNPLSFLFTKKISHVISTSAAPVHEVERNNELIREFTDDKAFPPALYPSAEDYGIAAAYKQQPYICISPASIWFTKQYPKEKWISFINSLPADFHILLLGAPTDKTLADEIIAQASGHSIHNLCGKVSLLQSAALMKDAVMNYVNDSAPMHIASSVNAPVTAVYCSTVPSFGFGPLSRRRSIVEIPHPLYCRPCGLHGYKVCPEGHFRCAKEINDQQLLATLPRENGEMGMVNGE
jgi:ADP-heptose:LPS heptosyltransferase